MFCGKKSVRQEIRATISINYSDMPSWRNLLGEKLPYGERPLWRNVTAKFPATKVLELRVFRVVIAKNVIQSTSVYKKLLHVIFLLYLICIYEETQKKIKQKLHK